MTLPVILNIAKHEQRQADKLIRYIKKLDGTEVRTFQFDDPPGMRYPEVANWAFRKIAKEMQGQAFIWVEADSVPLKAGWAKALSDEYEKQGKEYLYAKTFNEPWDRYSGIGIQGPNAYEHAPENFTTGGFDEWIARQYPDLIGRTDLIRHSYGIYDEKGDATLHQFPRDMHIIGNEAVLFHKDQRLDLISILDPSFAEERILNVSSVGDAGDLFLMLATLKYKGGTFDCYLRDNGATKGIVSRAHLVKPLLEAQPYINAVRIWKREDIDWSSEGFRPSYHRRDDNLAGAHARHAMAVGFIKEMPDFSQPWLTVEGDKKWKDYVVINRTPRYNNPYFPWNRVVEHYGERLIFIGASDEYEAFCRQFDRVRYCITNDFLEAAKVIAGSALFIGNQSACMTIAEGLKHPRILEAGLHVCDCIYHPANNVQHVIDGTVTLPNVAGSGELVVGSTAKNWRSYLINHVPNCGRNRWGWHYQHGDVMVNESSMEFMMKKLKRMTGWDEETCMQKAVEFTVAMNPEWFANKVRFPQFDVAKKALMNAKYEKHPILK